MSKGLNIGVNSPQAVKKWSSALEAQVNSEDYFAKFVGNGTDNIIERKRDLEADAGDEVMFDLLMRAKGAGVDGDGLLEGTADKLTFLQDKIKIDQHRKAFNTGGRMSRKRSLHDMRKLCKAQLKEYFREWREQIRFVYLSGARGNNDGDYILPTDFAGFAGNPILPPDEDHIMYAGAATSKASLTAADKMSRALIERAEVRSRKLMAKSSDNVNLRPVMVEGEKHLVMLMNTYQEHDLRQESGTTGWMEIQKAAATALGKGSPIFKGGLGMIKNVVLHSHEFGVTFGDYGAGANVAAGRALLLGAQAGVEAAGSTNGYNGMEWSEEAYDHGNQLEVAGGAMWGFKKTRYGDRDFGVIALDTAAADPN